MLAKYGVDTILQFIDYHIECDNSGSNYLQEIKLMEAEKNKEALAISLLRAKIERRKLHITESSIIEYIVTKFSSITDDKRVDRQPFQNNNDVIIERHNTKVKCKAIERSVDDKGYFIHIGKIVPNCFKEGQKLNIKLHGNLIPVEIRHDHARLWGGNIRLGIGVRVLEAA